MGGVVFKTKGLTIGMWLWCLFFGVGQLLWGQVNGIYKKVLSGPPTYFQILATIPSKRLPKKMAVGRGDIVEIPLVGYEEPDPLISPCEDRSAKGLWQWSARRINMKVR